MGREESCKVITFLHNVSIVYRRGSTHPNEICFNSERDRKREIEGGREGGRGGRGRERAFQIFQAVGNDG